MSTLFHSDEERRLDGCRRIFGSVLGSIFSDAMFKEAHVRISEDGKRLYEGFSSRVLSEAVLQVDFPRIEGPVDLLHFTSFGGFKSIMGSHSLYLTSLTKRLHQGEFTTLMQELKLDGYWDQDQETQKPIYEALSKDLFYCSFVEPGGPNESELWESFAELERGVRLRLRVTPKPPIDLRKVAYQHMQSLALKTINDKLLAQEKLIFNPWTISRICAFFLTFGFRHEREVRLMIKRQEGGPDDAKNFNGIEVWPVPLAGKGQSTGYGWCEIELLEVTAGTRCSLQRVKDVLASTGYGAVPAFQA